MRTTLQNWINDADSVRQLRFFSIPQMPIALAYITNRPEDFYISLVGEMFRCIDLPETPREDWAQLGNAFLQFAAETSDEQLSQHGVSKDDATLFAAASFYFGDYPASACLTMRRSRRPLDNQSAHAGCFDFLARPAELHSQVALDVRDSLLTGDLQRMDRLVNSLSAAERVALQEGPQAWIATKLLSRLLASFRVSNLRAVLPNGYDEFWSPLVESLINRRPSTWEFFPSQVEAISRGLLISEASYSLQMPTGAGKTTVCETLLYSYLKTHPHDVAVMLVPYRSLASELRGTLVQRLNAFGLAARCAYGGTVPIGDELHGLANLRAVIATPEALSGLLGADPAFAGRIGLIICDEGHLLDGGGRGIGLELLLARMNARAARSTRFVFISAIVPNIEEINAWLGGTEQTVVRSTYRPAIAEFAVLQPVGKGASAAVSLAMHPHEPEERQYSIDGFLSRPNFSYRNPLTGRQNTYSFSSIKTQAIAAARKVLPMGSAAIFAANKRGNQGAIGIAESLIAQLRAELPLPKPIDFSRQDAIKKSHEYLAAEYGTDWTGTKCIEHGVVLHHGDIPQETREILEGLVRDQDVKLVVCTSTLAEGVNLPIRTLVLYSVQRRQGNGQMQNMLARDIKNLVGRAGRAGANTKGLVICANPDQWQLLQPVALQGAGEPVKGSLRILIEQMTQYLAGHRIALDNQFLEHNTIIHPLIDGVDSTLMELLSSEVGEEEFVELAMQLAARTFAVRQLAVTATENLRSIFALRARRLIALRASGKTVWARETGAKIRLIDSVEQVLLTLRSDWEADVDPLDGELQTAIFQWAWTHPELRQDVRTSFRLDENADVELVKDQFFQIARLWMAGVRYKNIADSLGLQIDDVLAIHSRGITFSLQTLVEQGISLLTKRLEADGIELSEGVRSFPEHLRFGVRHSAGRMLAASGLRHRSAFVELGRALHNNNPGGTQDETVLAAFNSVKQFSEQWRTVLGELVYQHTLADLSHR